MAPRACHTGGPGASGKSTVAAAVAAEHGLKFIKIDNYFNVLRDQGLAEDMLRIATRGVARRLRVVFVCFSEFGLGTRALKAHFVGLLGNASVGGPAYFASAAIFAITR